MSKVFKSFMSMVITAILFASLTAIASAEEPPEGYVFKEETLTYNCHIRVPNPLFPLLLPPYLYNDYHNIDITIRADVPAQVIPGEEFDIYNASATVKVPEEIVQILYGILGWDEIEGEVTKFLVHSENLDKTIDVAKDENDEPAPIPIPVTPVPSTGDLEFTVPDIGLTVGKFKAGDSGHITIKGGEITAIFEKVGGSILKINADCTPPNNNTLVEIPIVP